MSLFRNINTYELRLLVKCFKTMLEESVTLTDNSKLKYIINLLHRETLREFDTFCIQIGKTTVTHLNQVILCLGK